MIRFTHGNMFDVPANIRINTVNCVGAMGAGVALAFKKKYPDMYKDYKKSCDTGKIRPGQPHIWDNHDLCEKITIINFPTKDHWKDPSQYQYIEDGLRWLRNFLKKHGTVTVTLPALGCGHGGLDWHVVKNMITQYLSDLNAEILVFEPGDSHFLENTLTDEQKKEFEIKGVKILTPSDEYYPQLLKGKSAQNLYVLGSTEIFSSAILAIFVSRTIELREQNAIDLCLKDILNENIVPIVGTSAGDWYIVKLLLMSQKKIIICTDVGILNFKIPRELKDCWNDNLVTIISFDNPNKKWSKFNYKEITKLKLYFAKAILVTAINSSWATKLPKEIREAFKGAFYINYGIHPDLLSNIDAIAISKSSRGEPKLGKLISKVLDCQQ